MSKFRGKNIDFLSNCLQFIRFWTWKKSKIWWRHKGSPWRCENIFSCSWIKIKEFQPNGKEENYFFTLSFQIKIVLSTLTPHPLKANRFKYDVWGVLIADGILKERKYNFDVRLFNQAMEQRAEYKVEERNSQLRLCAWQPRTICGVRFIYF